MANPDLIKAFTAETAVTARRIVKFGTADGNVIQAAAVTDGLMGVSDPLGGALNARVEVILDGIAEVEYGGNVTRGDLLTTDANGKAVTAAPITGTNNRIIGQAMVSGMLGDIGLVHIEPGQIQG